MELIARELIQLKQQKEEIEELYETRRNEMFNALVNSGLSSFNYDGWRFQQTKESTTRTISKERLNLALAEAGITSELRERIVLAASHESVRPAGIRMTYI